MENQTTPSCPKCYQPILDTDMYCQSCAYPLKGTEEEQKEHSIKQWENDFARQDNEKKLKNGTTTLYVVSGLLVLSGVVLYALSEDVATLIASFILAAMYLGLGFASKKYPFPAILIGLILFILIIVLDVVASIIDEKPQGAFSGIIVKVFVLIYLSKALRGAYAIRNNQ
jgi:hypothetical protein